MPLLKPFGWLLVAPLSLWQVAGANEAINQRFNAKKESFQQTPVHRHHHVKRAASSSSVAASGSSSFASFSSSSYVPSWPASSTFTVSESSSYSYVSSHIVTPTPTPASCGAEDCKFYSSDTKPYFIAEWPDVDFETGEFYGGSTPV